MSAKKSRKRGITPEIVGEASSRSVAYFVLASILAFFFLNHLAGLYLKSQGTNLGYRMIEAKWDLLHELEEKPDWLVLGDSSCAHGFVPENWDKIMGGRSLNLGTIANLLVSNDVWMLEEYIERFGAPEKVLLVHVADIWHRGYRSALIGKIPEPWGFWDEGKAPIDLTTEQRWKVWLSRYVPTYAENKTLSEHVLNFGPTKELDLKMGSQGFIPGRENDVVRLGRDYRRTLKTVKNRSNRRLSKANREALHALGTLSAEHGFDIYLAHGPLYDKLKANTDFAAFYKAQTRNIRKITREYKRLHLVSDILEYPKEQMEATVDHVHPGAAPGFTEDLARLMRSVLEERGN